MYLPASIARRLPAAFAAALITALCQPAVAVTFMTQKELLATIPGHSTSGKTAKGNKWTQVYSAGGKKGTIAGMAPDGAYKAKWYVKGNEWCEDWGSGHGCWHMERVGAHSLRIYINGKPHTKLWSIR